MFLILVIFFYCDFLPLRCGKEHFSLIINTSHRLHWIILSLPFFFLLIKFWKILRWKSMCPKIHVGIFFINFRTFSFFHFFNFCFFCFFVFKENFFHFFFSVLFWVFVLALSRLHRLLPLFLYSISNIWSIFTTAHTQQSLFFRVTFLFYIFFFITSDIILSLPLSFFKQFSLNSMFLTTVFYFLLIIFLFYVCFFLFTIHSMYLYIGQI